MGVSQLARDENQLSSPRLRARHSVMGRPALYLSEPQKILTGIPKLRHKEEKKIVIRMCISKLRDIQDPESLLCKSVLINNTVNWLKHNGKQRTDIKCDFNKNCETNKEVSEVNNG